MIRGGATHLPEGNTKVSQKTDHNFVIHSAQLLHDVLRGIV
jgi:hypothetical protein